MGIKIAFAWDSNGKKWDAKDYQKGMGMEPLTCPSCSTAVTHNPAYTRERHDKPSLVPAYFRLFPNGRHADTCRYAVSEKIQNIVRESGDLFEEIESGKHRLRLVMVKEAIEKKIPKNRDGAKNKNSKNGNSFTTNVRKLPPYINSARRVLALRAICDDDNSLSEYLELVFEGNTIVPWPNFYFETDRHREAFFTVLHNTSQHPIALHGTVGSKRLGIKNDEKANVINLQKSRYLANTENQTHGIGTEVSIWAKDARWISDISEDDDIIVFGLWAAQYGNKEDSKRPGRFNTFTTNRLKVNLALATQIIKIPKNE